MENNFNVVYCKFVGGSKLVVLDKVTKARINELFGPHKFNEGSDGYSKIYIFVAHKDAPKEIYSIYTHYGVFRIGGCDYGAHLGELMELINPVAFAGLSKKSTKEHLSRFHSRFQDL